MNYGLIGIFIIFIRFFWWLAVVIIGSINLVDLDSADFIDFMKSIKDLLNPKDIEAGEYLGESSREGPQNQGPGPEHNNSESGSQVPLDNGQSPYEKFADKLADRRNAVLAEREAIGAKSKSTSLKDLGVSFQKKSSFNDVAMARKVLGNNTVGSTIVGDSQINQIRNYRP